MVSPGGWGQDSSKQAGTAGRSAVFYNYIDIRQIKARHRHRKTQQLTPDDPLFMQLHVIFKAEHYD